jgi:Ca-activated chloride channel family protein
VASVTVEQVFGNPHEEPLEAAYHFPLPTGAAVDSMLVRTGGRVILGRIEEREVARIIYRQARDAGALAALLEQQRPNLFTQRVANIPPGESVRVEIHYVQLLPYDQGEYELMFPMVAGARAQDPTAGAGDDTLEQHTPGLRPSEAIDVVIDIDAGVPLEDLDSPSHILDVESLSDSSARVTLAADDRIPNRDLVVRYRVAGDLPRAAVLSHQDERGGFFTLMVQPGLAVPEDLATRRRLTFAVDTSSSMLGRPLVQAQAVINEALATLGPDDELQVVGFSDLVSSFAEAPVSGSDENVIAAETWVDSLRALGTTSMTAGIERVLAQGAADDDVLDVIVLVTDGYVASETELMRLAHERLGGRRLFTIGVGPAPNRFLLEQLAEMGRGQTLVISPSDHPEVAAQRFLERIEKPQLTDLEIDWGELTAHSVYPRRLPDLFEGQPLLVRGRYDMPGEGYVTVRGRMAGRQWEERVPVVLASADRTGNEAMAPIWARAAVHDLMNGLYLRDDPDREDAITDLGLRFGLVTRFTSFVAVEEAFLRSIGDATGNAYGYGGLGLSGTGAGGGGVGYGTIGLGDMGTIGHGSGVVGGADSESAYGVLAARSPMMMMMDRADGLAARPAVEPSAAPQIEAAAAEVRGSLSADTIRRTIELHRAEIRGVYERQLQTRPDITGRVTVRIVIGADGHVSAAEVTSSDIDCPELEAALLAVFRRMTFPPVEGGGTNVVTYPVVFVPTEDE